MKFDAWKVTHNSTLFLCLSTTIGLSVYSIMRYLANEDLTLVQVSKYHSNEDSMYPSHTICIINPFLDDRFDIFNDDWINKFTYVKFLSGEFWDDSMLDIDYDNVTVSLVDNLLESSYITINNEFYLWDPVYYTSFRSSYRKCFTVEAPRVSNDLLTYFGNVISNNIFPNGGRDGDNSVIVYMHYPGTRFKSFYTLKWINDSRGDSSESYWMKFTVKNVDVISRRNKPQEPCVEDWKHFDDYILNRMAIENGCRPKYWNLTANVPYCTTTTQMKKFKDQPTQAMIESHSSPCRFIDRLDYIYEELDVIPIGNQVAGLVEVPFEEPDKVNSYIKLGQVHYHTSYTEKIQVRAYTSDDVVGTVGGYVGLFMGYAVVQLPAMIKSIFCWFKTRQDKRKISNQDETLQK